MSPGAFCVLAPASGRFGMDRLRFLEQLGAELAWRGVSGYRIERNRLRGRVNLHSELGHLAVKLYQDGELKVEICCEGMDPAGALSILAPICRELEACMGQPGHEERVDGAHRLRWSFNRNVVPGSEQIARHWAADFLEAGWRRTAQFRDVRLPED